jgi:hypothetical protein
VPQNVALAGPTCPCNVQPPLQPQKVNAPVKRVEPDPPKRVDRKPRRPPPPDDEEVVVVRRPPPVVYEPAGPPVGIGIGIGIGGGGRYGGGNYGGGSYGRRGGY